MANMFCDGQKIVTDQYRDNHMRIFRGIPSMNDVAKAMVDEWIDAGEYRKVLLFFIEKCGYDAEYSGFILRELID